MDQIGRRRAAAYPEALEGCAHVPLDGADAQAEVPGDLWKNVKISRIAIDTERCITYRDVECGVCVRASRATGV